MLAACVLNATAVLSRRHVVHWIQHNGAVTAYSPQFGNCSVPHDPALTNVASLGIFQAASGTWSCSYKHGKIGNFPGCFCNMILLLQTWQHLESSRVSGNILLTGIAHRPFFGQREQSVGEDTSTSWKVLFAKTFSPAAQETVKQNVHNLVWQTFDLFCCH
jgi:hypothetical protein